MKKSWGTDNSALSWDEAGSKLYETGTKQGVLYPQNTENGTYPAGVAWNGLSAVTESPSGAESNPIYADDIKYVDLISTEEFGATVEAYTYPDEFAECDGSAEIAPGIIAGQQTRKPFGLSYVTILGNDTALEKYGYKLHLIYGAKASPSERSYQTVNDSPEAITFSWELTTTPVACASLDKPTACLTIDSTKVDATKLANLEKILYGEEGDVTYEEFSGTTFVAGTTYYEKNGTAYFPTSDTTKQESKTYYTKTVTGGTTPRLPLPDEIVTIFA